MCVCVCVCYMGGGGGGGAGLIDEIALVSLQLYASRFYLHKNIVLEC